MRPVTLDLGGVNDPKVAAALLEVQRASQDTLQNDTSSSGSAMATLIGAAADEIAYFTSSTTTAFTALTAFARASILTLTSAAGLVSLVQPLLSVFGASGGGHSKGLVPDPGAAAGTNHFLREDATFAQVDYSNLTGTPPAGSIPSGSVMAFYQTSVPTGWTRVTTFDDALTRIVGSATPGSGGSNGFVATFNSQTVTGNTTISTSTMPAHAHTGGAPTGIGCGGANIYESIVGCRATSNTANTGSVGSGGAHNHTITTAIKYVDAMLASKN